MLGIIQCKALNMLNPEKIVPEVRLPLRYRQSPRENRQYATDNRQPAVNKEIDLMQAQQVRRWPGSTLPVVEVDALERLL